MVTADLLRWPTAAASFPPAERVRVVPELSRDEEVAKTVSPSRCAGRRPREGDCGTARPNAGQPGPVRQLRAGTRGHQPAHAAVRQIEHAWSADIAVDAIGLPVMINVTPDDTTDRDAARERLWHLRLPSAPQATPC